MSRRPRLEAIGSLPTAPFETIAYRVVPAKHKERLVSTEGNRYFPGRYHLAGETGVLYTSLKEAAALSEIRRHSATLPLSEGLVIGKIRIRLTRVADLTRPEHLKTLGIEEGNLVSPDLLPTQAIGLSARAAGIQGLIVPSATGEGNNLVVFENNLGVGCLIQVESVQPLRES